MAAPRAKVETPEVETPEVEVAKLAANVALVHPDSGEVAVLVEGTVLPDWAVGLVGSHALVVESTPDA